MIFESAGKAKSRIRWLKVQNISKRCAAAEVKEGQYVRRTSVILQSAGMCTCNCLVRNHMLFCVFTLPRISGQWWEREIRARDYAARERRDDENIAKVHAFGCMEFKSGQRRKLDFWGVRYYRTSTSQWGPTMILGIISFYYFSLSPLVFSLGDRFLCFTWVIRDHR